MRIAKAMAHAGLCSRREAERWIADGRVSVNGKLLKTPAVEVSGSDKIFVDGKPLPTAGPPQLWRYHKPKGIVTTHSDPQGRPTVFEKMPPEMPRVISVGRLDFNTEGLLLLTNNGELARHLELPINGWVRRYRVRAKGRVAAEDLTKLKDGIAELPNVSLSTPREPALSAGIVCCQVRGLRPAEAVGALRSHDVIASATPYANELLRFGTSIATDEADVDRALAALRALS